MSPSFGLQFVFNSFSSFDFYETAGILKKHDFSRLFQKKCTQPGKTGKLGRGGEHILMNGGCESEVALAKSMSNEP